MSTTAVQRAVWKYSLSGIDHTLTLQVPSGASVVHVDNQHETACLWFEVSPDAPKDARHFQLICTGETIPYMAVYRGSCLLRAGTLVLHVYEV
jgi:hypothetical protein